MLPYFTDTFGNPASTLNAAGRKAAEAVDSSRETIADVLGVKPKEIIFTAGATESNNLALRGIAKQAPAERRQIITTAIEHKSILETYRDLAEQGFDLKILPVQPDGRLDLLEFKQALSEKTLIVSVQAANNEIGTLQDIEAISDLAHKQGAFVHCDAAQAVGKVPFDFLGCGADLVSISAHKVYGPKGVGLLFVRGGVRAIPISPIQHGGGQEYGLRPGTLNVPGIVGFAAALKLLNPDEGINISKLRDAFESALLAKVPGASRNGSLAHRLPNNSSITIPGIDAEALIANMPDLALSTGSACTSGAPDPSHVLIAIGLTRAEALSTIRIGLGRITSSNDLSVAADSIAAAVGRLQGLTTAK
jgi:cysteine desulfurase